MREDRMRQLFSLITLADVGIPDIGLVVLSGRQRRRRALMGRSAFGTAAVLAVGVGMSHVFAHLPATGGARAAHRDLHRAIGPASSEPRHPMPQGGIPVHGSQARNAIALPPPGSGQLVLGLTADHRFVMSRVGSGDAPVPVPRLPGFADSLLVTNPAGGWIVTYCADRAGPAPAGSIRFALVTPTGQAEPFGPVFRDAVVSAAVSPDGDRIAVSIFHTRRPGSATIEVRPMPGFTGARRTWSLPPAEANFATGLSWAPDGRHLTYTAGLQTGGGVGGGPETLDTTAPGSVAPGTSKWRATRTSGQPCVPEVSAWLGTSGMFAALENCVAGRARSREIFQAVNPRTGSAAGRPVVISHDTSCSPFGGIDSSRNGGQVLITYCQVKLEDRGVLTNLPGSLRSAALAG